MVQVLRLIGDHRRGRSASGGASILGEKEKKEEGAWEVFLRKTKRRRGARGRRSREARHEPCVGMTYTHVKRLAVLWR